MSVLLRRRLQAAAIAVLMAMTLMVAPASSSAAAPVAGSNGTACLGGTPSGTMPAPFLELPFRAADAVNSSFVSAGWKTPPDELAIDDETNGDLHGAIDFELVRSPDHGYGKPILAAASGRAYYSYQYRSGRWTDPATGITHQVGWGGGLFVEIRHAQDTPGNAGWVTQYIHLSKVASGIPYLAPTAVDDPDDPAHPDWFPTPITQSDDTLWGLGVPVVQGQVIGYLGDTGIGLDWKDKFDVVTGKVASRNRVLLKPWDPPQLHFQAYQGRVDGVKQNIVDPMGWFAQTCPGEFVEGQFRVNPYGFFPGFLKVAPTSAFLTGPFGRPLYAG